MDKPIKIRNESGEESQIMPESLPVWEEHGWTAVEDGSSEGEHRAVVVPPVATPEPVKVQPDPSKKE